MRLNNQDIQKYHRHRFPYLLVDCVEEIEAGKSVIGYKNFSEDEWLFHCNVHEDEPVPFTMLIEILTEVFLLPILILDGNEGEITNFVSADDAEVYEDVYPGDCMKIRAIIKSWRLGVARGIAEGYVDGALVCRADLSFVIPRVMEKYRPKKIG